MLISYFLLINMYGFRSGRSTLSRLLLVNVKFIECINNRACIDGVYTDISKVFDFISHKNL